MSKKNGENPAARKFKNRILGAIKRNDNTAKFKAASDLSAHFGHTQHLIAATLAEARDLLPVHAAMEFESWVELQFHSQNRRRQFGPSLQELGIPLKSVELTELSSALILSMQALERHSSEVAQIASQARAIDQLIEEARHEDAIKIISNVNRDFGYSYWSIEMEIALAAQLGGAEAAKERYREYSKQSRNLSIFYYYCFALRADPSQTPARYKAALRKKISAANLTKHQKIVSLYRACGDLPHAAEDLAVLLTAENLSSKIDLIFTAIHVARKVHIARGRIGGARALKGAEELLEKFGPQVYPDIIKINEGKIIFAISDGIQEAIGAAINTCLQRDTQAAPVNSTAAWLAASLSTAGGSLSDEDALHRFSTLFPSHSWAMQWGLEPSIPKLPEIFWECSSTDAQEKSDLLLRTIEEKLRSFLKDSPLGVPCELESIATLDDIYTELTPSARDCVDVFVGNLYIELDLPADSIRRCVLAILQNPRLMGLMPLSRLFQGRSWKAVSQYGESLALCTALHQYYMLGENHHAKSFKRFAVIALMKRHQVENLDSLVELLFASQNIPPVLSDYFARFVCDLPLIELLPRVSNTKQAREVQSGLFRIAAKYSPDSADTLLMEADAIDAKIEVDTAMEVLDDTRVYVAEDQLAALAERDLNSAFERYALIAEDAPSTDLFLESMLREIKQHSYFPTPKTESDDLLFELVADLVELFINDPANGLDSVIGRRIRHGSISGELRGTLDGLNLIGHKPKSGADYDMPSMAVNALAHCDPRVQRGAYSAFSRFSGSIDSIVATLRDEAFQCRTKDGARLRAAFEFSMSNVISSFAKSMAKNCPDVGAFAKCCFGIFWISLNAKVERERGPIAEYLKHGLRDAFSKLTTEIRNLAPDALELLGAIQHASEELQRRSAIIVSWIRIPELSESRQTFPLSLVLDMTVSVVRGRRPSFDPVVVLHLSRDILLNLAGLAAVEDAVQIAIDNVALHSGVKRNTIEMKVEVDKVGDKLNFLIVSEIAKNAWTKERADRVAQNREVIRAHRAGERAKANSGSGLSRLAALVQQDGHCHIDFGIDESNKFRLEFSLCMTRLIDDAMGSEDLRSRWEENLVAQ
jgi:hypothetical protein